MISLRLPAVLICLFAFLTGHAAGVINVGNYVWSDADYDGVQDPGEVGVAGVTVQLWNSAKNDLIDSTTTNSNGNYTLEAPGPGDYRVRFLLPGTALGFSPMDETTDTTDSDVNPSGTDFGFTDVYTFGPNLISIVSIDCGLLPDPMGSNNVGDRVFNANTSGTQTGAYGIGGVTVQLRNSSGTVLQTTITDTYGYYSFLANPGSYRLHFVFPSGRLPTPLKDAGGDDANDSDIDDNGDTALFTVTSTAVKIHNLDAGFVYSATVGNLVWSDVDEDGIKDTSEPGIPGTTVQIWNDSLNKLLGTDTTDANGIYSLEVLPGASYRVRVIPRYAGDRLTVKNAGSDDLKDSDFNPSGSYAGFTDVLPIASNVISITSIDAGIVEDPMKDHNIGDRAFRASAGGLQETGNVSGVQVELYNTSGLVATTTTATNGFYSFKAAPGTYRLHFTAPGGMIPSPHPNQGFDNDIDSDINADGYTSWFTLAAGAVRRDLDAGFVYLIAMGNLVWHDVDGDGIKDASEEGVPNVELELWDEDKTSMLASTVSNSNGNYTLQAPGPGNYRIWALRPMGTDEFSPKDAGTDDLVDSDVNPSGDDFGFTAPITVASNVVSITSIDVGMTFTGNATARTITPFRITGLRRDAANWLIDYQAPVFGTYVIEAATDLKNWEEVGSSFPTISSTGTRSVALTPSVPKKCFRMRRTR
ncbi:SdrD B-like domain-containing protein [Haloferula sp. BvORR071]|uniref:SdrD B-like domain-containing protein n=1 Tax=Haloferula sp. BvORR071 TaxID=1396141 RepID=UPI00055206C7|nr:SdrD B-like domain-containing protein [Haloferula sp. BvORR071]